MKFICENVHYLRTRQRSRPTAQKATSAIERPPWRTSFGCHAQTSIFENPLIGGFKMRLPSEELHYILTAAPRTDLLPLAIMSPDNNTLEGLRIDRAARPERGSSLRLIAVGLVIGALVVVSYFWFNRMKAVEVRTFVVQET